MDPVENVQQLEQLLASLRSQFRQSLTNLYLTAGTLAQWGRLGRLYQFSAEGCLLLVREEAGFHRVYFLAASTQAIESAAAALEQLPPAPLVMDLVGPESKLAEVQACWQDFGFSPYRRFIRLWRPGLTEQVAGDDGIHVAAPSEAESICGLLHQEFDPYSEHLPDPDEVRRRAERAEVLFVKEADQLAALLIFERTGVTSNLRYWYVRPESRGQKLGSRLMRRYFAASEGAQRMILWVDDENVGAKDRYEHYGYRADGLTDRILVKQAP
jgi:GNAT superfamily N-acetyltransferase